MIPLDSSPRCVNNARGKSRKTQERLKPPRIATSCFSKLTLGQGPHGLRHRRSSEGYRLVQDVQNHTGVRIGLQAGAGAGAVIRARDEGASMKRTAGITMLACSTLLCVGASIGLFAQQKNGANPFLKEPLR